LVGIVDGPLAAVLDEAVVDARAAGFRVDFDVSRVEFVFPGSFGDVAAAPSDRAAGRA
jgi:hypothetical protein